MQRVFFPRIARVAQAIAGLAATILVSNSAWAQAPRGFFTDPNLVLAGPGHSAPVRSLIFATPNGSHLLSGGLDRQIHAWNLDVDRSTPTRTLRPPLGRGGRGAIQAMALSPRADERGQRLLAVAGRGVLGQAGEILLFRYPGFTPQGTGEIEAQLPVLPPDGSAVPGHTDVVNALAFSPDGKLLASASNDATVRIWEVASRRHVAALAGHVGAVNTLAFTPDGARIISGGADGVLRSWEVTNPAAPPRTALPEAAVLGADPLARQILSLAVSPDGRWLVVGREDGHLLRFDAPTLGNPVYLPEARFPGGTTGPVEAVAISPDGTRLATSAVVSALPTPGAFPTVACDVALRAMPNGQVVARLARTSNLTVALAFSPDGKRLAFSGGDDQAIHVRDLAAPAVVGEPMRGPGSSLWDVGFRTDGAAIRFARQRPGQPGAAPIYEGFDLRERHYLTDASEGVFRHALAVDQGWTITPVDPFTLRASNGAVTTTLTLDPNRDLRWWSFTVVPPGPGRPAPMAAVACGDGVALFTLPGGVRTHHFVGHGGPVYTVAASPDGRWLLTGSGDQTVRLWPLTAADRPAPFGARFQKNPAGAWTVAEVTAGGFADGIGLQAGDVIEEFYVDRDRSNPDALLPNLDAQPPTRMFSFFARRAGTPDLVKVGATKRDSPALTLFPGEGRRWVLWTPQGFYDTSADGDRDTIGWLTNRGTVARLQAGSFDPIRRFEPRYRQRKALQPNVIDRLLETADVVAAQAALIPPPPPNAPDAPADPTTSRVNVLTLAPVEAAPIDAPVAVVRPTLDLRYEVLAAEGAARIRALWVEVNGRKVADLVAGAPVQQAQGQRAIPIDDVRTGRVTLVAVDEKGVERTETLDVANQRPPEPARRAARLEVIALGGDRFTDPRLPAIPRAGRDARDLGRFLGHHLVDPGTNLRFRPDQVRVRVFTGVDLASSSILSAFDEFRSEGAQPGGLPGPGDVVAVVLESHYLDVHSRPVIAATETVADGDQALPALTANDLAGRLGELTRLGCRVVVLVDAVHEVKVAGWENNIQEWVRRLQTESKALVFVASDHGPSSANGDGHRVFAQAVLDVLKVRSASRLRNPSDRMSVFDAQRTIADSVQELTGRRQQIQCLIPEILPPRALIFDPDVSQSQ